MIAYNLLPTAPENIGNPEKVCCKFKFSKISNSWEVLRLKQSGKSGSTVLVWRIIMVVFLDFELLCKFKWGKFYEFIYYYPANLFILRVNSDDVKS